MRLSVPRSEDDVLRLGAAVAALVFLACGALSAELAVAHMRGLGVICGGVNQPHCGWCAAAFVLAAASVVSLAWSLRRRARPASIRIPAVRN